MTAKRTGRAETAVEQLLRIEAECRREDKAAMRIQAVVRRRMRTKGKAAAEYLPGRSRIAAGKQADSGRLAAGYGAW